MREPTMTKSKEQAYKAHLADLKVLHYTEGCVRSSIATLVDSCLRHEDPQIAALAMMLEHNMKAEADARAAAAASVKAFFDTV